MFLHNDNDKFNLFDWSRILIGRRLESVQRKKIFRSTCPSVQCNMEWKNNKLKIKFIQLVSITVILIRLINPVFPKHLGFNKINEDVEGECFWGVQSWDEKKRIVGKKMDEKEKTPSDGMVVTKRRRTWRWRRWRWWGCWRRIGIKKNRKSSKLSGNGRRRISWCVMRLHVHGRRLLFLPSGLYTSSMVRFLLRRPSSLEFVFFPRDSSSRTLRLLFDSENISRTLCSLYLRNGSVTKTFRQRFQRFLYT